MSVPFVRFDKTIPVRATPSDCVDLFYNAATGQLALREGTTLTSVGSGSVNNSTVNAALAENPAESQEALEIDAIELTAELPTQGSVAPTAISGAAIDWDAGDFREKTLTGNTTFTFSNVTADQIIEIYLTQTAGNSWGVNWPVGITWAGGSAPGVPTAETSTRVVLHAITASTFHGYFETSATVPTTVDGTDPVTLGRSAIVTHSDGTSTEWSAVSISPHKWLPRTAGILWDDTNDLWVRTYIGGGTLQQEVLPDQ